MKIHHKLRNVIGMMSCAGALLTAASASAALFQVTVNTSPLMGNPNGPYYVDFQFNAGDESLANSATVNNFDFGGGSASAPGSAIVYLGSPSGDLSTGFNFSTGTTPYNEIAQQFTPGQTLTFDVSLTDNGGIHIPAGFVFSIDDGTTFQIPTTSSPDGLTFASIDINPASSNTPFSVATYSLVPAEYAGVTVSVVAVPEPSTMAAGFFALGLGVVALFRPFKVANPTKLKLLVSSQSLKYNISQI